MTYKFKFRKHGSWFWHSYQVRGHHWQKDGNRMDLFLLDGSVLSVGDWDKCDLKLGPDWVLATKENMEEQTGTDIKLRGIKTK